MLFLKFWKKLFISNLRRTWSKQYYLGSDYQSGFRSSFFTDTCLIHLLDNIKLKNAKGLYTGMTLLDLQKAFDTVDHHISCSKLKLMGIQSTKWFETYLSNRSQSVNIGKCHSETAAVIAVSHKGVF